MRFILSKNHIEDEIKLISETFEKYNLFFKDVCDSHIGKYSINSILETVEEALNYLEICSPVLKKWVYKYLEENRGQLWLYYGICAGTHVADYWKIRKTDLPLLQKTWPFLFNRTCPIYETFTIDLTEAQKGIIAHRDRQLIPNPNYTPYHPNGCNSGCCCWMLDDMEQWHTEKQLEIKSSRNIFFNTELQSDFYKAAVNDLQELKEQWVEWEPEKSTTSRRRFESNLSLEVGHTPIKIVISWIKNDFYCNHIFSIFSFSDFFKELWENIDSVTDFIKIQREKLKKIVEIL